jgi:hypothetical protein
VHAASALLRFSTLDPEILVAARPFSGLGLCPGVSGVFRTENCSDAVSACETAFSLLTFEALSFCAFATLSLENSLFFNV